MDNPFEVLGLQAWADPDEIRSAYRSKAKQCHPDQFQDPERKKAAQDEMIRLNLAYEQAIKLATPRQHAAYEQEIPKEEAVRLAKRMLERNSAESALRQLDRSDSRDAVPLPMAIRSILKRLIISKITFSA